MVGVIYPGGFELVSIYPSNSVHISDKCSTENSSTLSPQATTPPHSPRPSPSQRTNPPLQAPTLHSSLSSKVLTSGPNQTLFLGETWSMDRLPFLSGILARILWRMIPPHLSMLPRVEDHNTSTLLLDTGRLSRLSSRRRNLQAALRKGPSRFRSASQTLLLPRRTI